MLDIKKLLIYFNIFYMGIILIILTRYIEWIKGSFPIKYIEVFVVL